MNIVFDLGGVLFRWQPHEFMARLIPQRTQTRADTQALIADFFEGFAGDWGEFDRGMLEAGPLADRIAARTGLGLPDVRKVIGAIPHELEPLRDTVALLHRLHGTGHPLYFLSNMPAPYADHLEANHDFLALFFSTLVEKWFLTIERIDRFFHNPGNPFMVLRRARVHCFVSLNLA